MKKARQQRDNRKAKEQANAASSEAGKPEPETANLPLAHPDANEAEEATSSIPLAHPDANEAEEATSSIPLAHPDANEAEEATSSIPLASLDAAMAEETTSSIPLAHPDANEADETTSSIPLAHPDANEAEAAASSAPSAGFRANRTSEAASPVPSTDDDERNWHTVGKDGRAKIDPEYIAPIRPTRPGANRPRSRIIAILQSASSDARKLKALMAVFRSINREANAAEIALILLLPTEDFDKFDAILESLSLAGTATGLEAEIAFILLTAGNDVNRLAAAIRSYHYGADEEELASILQSPIADVDKLRDICLSVDYQKTWLCLKDGEYGTAMFSYNNWPAKSHTGFFKYNTIYSRLGPVANRLVIKMRKPTSIRGWPHHEGREYGADGSGAQDGWDPLSIPAGGDTIWKSTASFQFLPPEGQSDLGAAGSGKIFVVWI